MNRQLIFICENDLIQQIGGTIHVIELLTSLAKLKSNITLIAPNYHGEKISIAPGINTIFIKTNNVRILKWLIFYLASTVTILRLFLKYKKIVIYSREMPYNVFLPLLTRLLRIPLFIELNGVFLKEMRDLNYSNYAYQASRFVEKFILSKTDKITCVSDEIRQTVSALLNLPIEKFITIPNGTNPELFYPLDKNKCRNTLNLPLEAFVIGFIGSCYPYHDIDTLITSVPKLIEHIPELKIAIIGNGIMLSQWQQLAENLGLASKVIFTGYAPFHNANLYINSFDICFASYKRETSVFPLKILDYLACNKAVITTNIPTITKYFTEKPFFKLIEPENRESLIKNIMDIYSTRNFEIKDHRQFVLDNYTWEHTAQKILKTIEI